MFTGEDFQALIEGRRTEEEAESMLRSIADRGETVEEVVALVRVLRSHQRSIPGYTQAMDTCGTGGSGLSRFNTSTAVAFVLAAAGVSVIKHGNRAASGRFGSFDLLEALGCRIELEPDQVARTVDLLGVGFCFARRYHPVLATLAPLRQRIGIRTIFNAVGPLLNPAEVRTQLLGVSDPGLARTVAQALVHLGCERALVVTGEDGLDELTLTGLSQCIEVRGHEIREFSLTPETVGLKRLPVEPLGEASLQAQAATFREVLNGRSMGAQHEVVAFNAGAALVMAGRSPTWRDGVERALTLLASGAPGTLLDRYVSLTQVL